MRRSRSVWLLHEEALGNTSRIGYAFRFTTKPGILRFAPDPLMGANVSSEVRKRPWALKRHFGQPVFPK